MNVVICDDIPEFANELKSMAADICAQRDWLLNAQVFSSPYAMLNADLSKIQAIFLDIDMPELNGIEAAKALRSKYPELIIVFVTSYIEYAPVGYHVSAFRYILKQQLSVTLPEVMEDIQQKLCESSDTISAQTKSGIVSVPLKGVLYFEGTPHRRTLIYVDSPNLLIEATGKLSDFENRLVGKGFLRLQKSFIANMAHISKISSYQVFLDNGAVLKASEKHYKQVCATFLQWKGRYL